VAKITIRDFSGGQNTKIDSVDLPDNTAVIARNVDFENKIGMVHNRLGYVEIFDIAALTTIWNVFQYSLDDPQSLVFTVNYSYADPGVTRYAIRLYSGNSVGSIVADTWNVLIDSLGGVPRDVSIPSDFTLDINTRVRFDVRNKELRLSTGNRRTDYPLLFKYHDRDDDSTNDFVISAAHLEKISARDAYVSVSKTTVYGNLQGDTQYNYYMAALYDKYQFSLLSSDYQAITTDASTTRMILKLQTDNIRIESIAVYKTVTDPENVPYYVGTGHFNDIVQVAGDKSETQTCTYDDNVTITLDSGNFFENAIGDVFNAESELVDTFVKVPKSGITNPNIDNKDDWIYGRIASYDSGASPAAITLVEPLTGAVTTMSELYIVFKGWYDTIEEKWYCFLMDSEDDVTGNNDFYLDSGYVTDTPNLRMNYKYRVTVNDIPIIAGLYDLFDKKSYPDRFMYAAISGDGAVMPDSFPSSNFEDASPGDGDAIMGLGVNNNYAIIFKKNSIHVYDINNFAFTDSFSNVGCIASKTVQSAPAGVYFLAIDGVRFFRGLDSQLISEPIFNDISDNIDSTAFGIYHPQKREYWITLKPRETGEQTYIFSEKTGTWKEFNNGSLYLPYQGCIGAADGELIVTDKNYLYEMNTGTTDQLPGSELTQSISGTWQTKTYRAPQGFLFDLQRLSISYKSSDDCSLFIVSPQGAATVTLSLTASVEIDIYTERLPLGTLREEFYLKFVSSEETFEVSDIEVDYRLLEKLG
jgi:hypothetical protein